MPARADSGRNGGAHQFGFPCRRGRIRGATDLKRRPSGAWLGLPSARSRGRAGEVCVCTFRAHDATSSPPGLLAARIGAIFSLRPRVRRVRRWSFVATVPLSLLVAHIYGVHEGIAVVAARLALSASVAIAAWRLGGDRGDALRDLLMHPRLRAFGRAELDILTALPRLLNSNYRSDTLHAPSARNLPLEYS